MSHGNENVWFSDLGDDYGENLAVESADQESAFRKFSRTLVDLVLGFEKRNIAILHT